MYVLTFKWILAISNISAVNNKANASFLTKYIRFTTRPNYFTGKQTSALKTVFKLKAWIAVMQFICFLLFPLFLSTSSLSQTADNLIRQFTSRESHHANKMYTFLFKLPKRFKILTRISYLGLKITSLQRNCYINLHILDSLQSY